MRTLRLLVFSLAAILSPQLAAGDVASGEYDELIGCYSLFPDAKSEYWEIYREADGSFAEHRWWESDKAFGRPKKLYPVPSEDLKLLSNDGEDGSMSWRAVRGLTDRMGVYEFTVTPPRNDLSRGPTRFMTVDTTYEADALMYKFKCPQH